ncbi:hypothetical protein GCM10011363_20270 [Marivita lacus]|uniref:Uncharacterized protein n=1 Tax=Marivita lacus TaxID=1323742 RepID=A0ABQ1KL03_9RHOB|nr:hypothetical protein [Marivita lacus]GGC03624.1 hypothetical protein GCM10011363_20270 [Marivita lacus]
MTALREAAEMRVSAPGALDLLPSVPVDPARIDLESFLADDLRGRIRQYFAMDVTLCWTVRRGAEAQIGIPVMAAGRVENHPVNRRVSQRDDLVITVM